jgi:hypothetical protein
MARIATVNRRHFLSALFSPQKKNLFDFLSESADDGLFSGHGWVFMKSAFPHFFSFI